VLLRTCVRDLAAGATMYRLYDFLPSGNGYKVRLVLKQLGIPYELVEVDILNGGSRTPEFLAMNPNGRIPVLEVPGRGYLPESHAIISFLAEGSHLIPTDAFDRARMWQWLCFEQYHVEPNLGTVRLWTSLLHKTRVELGDKLIEKKKSGYAALDVLEESLRDRTFLVAERYTLADISLFAYTHVAHEGGFDLAPYPHVRSWVARVQRQSRWAPITEA
jgi:glutathione S-transferase